MRKRNAGNVCADALDARRPPPYKAKALNASPQIASCVNATSETPTSLPIINVNGFTDENRISAIRVPSLQSLRPGLSDRTSGSRGTSQPDAEHERESFTRIAFLPAASDPHRLQLHRLEKLLPGFCINVRFDQPLLPHGAVQTLTSACPAKQDRRIAIKEFGFPLLRKSGGRIM